MATDINKFAVTGRMTAEARLEYTQGGMAICTGSIAVNRSTTNKQDGSRKDDASFFDIKILGKFAESISRYLVKGQEAAIAGYLKQDRWQAQDGSNRSRVVLMVEELKLLGGRNNGQQQDGYNDGGAGDYGDVNGAFNNGGFNGYGA